MRKFWAVLSSFILALSLALPVLAGGDFEGIVAYKMTTSGKTMDMEYMLKGGKVRTEMKQGDMKMSMIMDPGAKKVTTLMHQQKMYMTSTMDGSLAGKAAKADVGKFTKVDGSKTILGYKCEHWRHEGKNGSGDFWLAKGLGAFAGMAPSRSGPAKLEDWVKAVQNKGLFAMEVDYKTKQGNMNMVATKVEKKSLSSSLFAPPSDYKKMPSWDGAASRSGEGTAKQPSAEDILKGMKF